MKKLFLLTAMAVLLSACNNEDSSEVINDKAIEETPETQEDDSISWSEQLTQLAVSEDNADYKFYALESYMGNYKATMPEIELFKAQVLNSYKDGSYLANIENDELVLTYIFQSYILSTHLKDEAWQHFSESYYYNIVNVYRGIEDASSEKVKENEVKMNEVLNNLQ